MDTQDRIELTRKNTVEIVTDEELVNLFETKQEPTSYIGFEPSGLMHLGQLICINKVRELQLAGVRVTILLADWHALINDKLGGDMKNIQLGARYLVDVFTAAGIDVDKLDFQNAANVVDGGDYWATLLRVAKLSSLSRIRRAVDIMGRQESELEVDFSKFIYPAMQVTDIFELGIDIAQGGIDQRKAHMLARDVADRLKCKKPIGLHTPLLSSLTSQDKMDYTNKMSKSKPEQSILIHDKEFDVSPKIKKAFCPEGDVDNNPLLDVCQLLVFPIRGTLHVKRKEQYGGDLEFQDFGQLKELFASKQLHPGDLKPAVRDAVNDILQPYRDYFKAHPQNYKALEKLVKRLNKTR